jgi:hypothetical protein
MGFFDKEPSKDSRNADDSFRLLQEMRERVKATLRTIHERNPASNLPISQPERITLERSEALFNRFLRIVHDPVESSDLRAITAAYGSVKALLGSLGLAIDACNRILLMKSVEVEHMQLQVWRTESLMQGVRQFIVTVQGKEVLKTIDEDMQRTIPRKLDAFTQRLQALDIDHYDQKSLFEQNRIQQEVLNISEDVAFLSAILKMDVSEETVIEEGFQSQGNPYAPPRDLPIEPDTAEAEKQRKIYFREPFQSLANPYAAPSTPSPLLYQGREFVSDLPK